ARSPFDFSDRITFACALLTIYSRRRGVEQRLSRAPVLLWTTSKEAPPMTDARRRPLSLLLTAAALLLALAPATALAQAADPEAPEVPAAALYCAQSGGNVHTRYPAYGTNDAAPLRLAGERRFCEFEAADSSRIAVALDPLYATAPTLATLAYLTPP